MGERVRASYIVVEGGMIVREFIYDGPLIGSGETAIQTLGPFLQTETLYVQVRVDDRKKVTMQ